MPAQLRRARPESALLKLLIEDASLLVDLYDGLTVDVCDHAPHPIARETILRSEFTIARVFLGDELLVANGDMWVNESIGQRNMYVAISIVGLGEAI